MEVKPLVKDLVDVPEGVGEDDKSSLEDLAEPMDELLQEKAEEVVPDASPVVARSGGEEQEGVPVAESRSKDGGAHRPKNKFPQLISEAILSSPAKMMSLAGIYEYIESNYGFYRWAPEVDFFICAPPDLTRLFLFLDCAASKTVCSGRSASATPSPSTRISLSCPSPAVAGAILGPWPASRRPSRLLSKGRVHQGS